MWGGEEGRRKITWVGWEDICLPKEKGGLGVKNIRLFNVALLRKWKWRVYSDHNCLWQQVLCSKYSQGNLFLAKRKSRKDSLWWRDFVGACGEEIYDQWFDKNVYRRVGDGRLIQFWKQPWVGNYRLEDKYGRVFMNLNQK